MKQKGWSQFKLNLFLSVYANNEPIMDNEPIFIIQIIFGAYHVEINLKGDGECILQVVWYVFYIQMTLCAGAHGIKYSAYHHGAM